MLKFITICAVLLALIIGAVLAYATTRPDRFAIQRSATIKASTERIFPLINDLRAFNTWNPFDKKDPNTKGSYSGAPSGKGAVYAFESGKSGTGTLEIIDVASPSKVTMRLAMIKPIEATNRVEFTLEPQGETTRVTWAMDGEVPYIGKILHLIFDMDKMVGQDFENGLADLKILSEKTPSPAG